MVGGRRRRSAQQAAEGGRRLGDLLVDELGAAFRLGLHRGLRHAVTQVLRGEIQAEGLQRLRDGGDLREDVDAVHVLVHHAVEAAHLPLDAAQSRQVLRLVPVHLVRGPVAVAGVRRGGRKGRGGGGRRRRAVRAHTPVLYPRGVWVKGSADAGALLRQRGGGFAQIGDQAADIAEIVKSTDMSLVRGFPKIPQMAAKTSEMVHDAVRSFVDRDLALATATQAADDAVDRMFDEVATEMIDFIVHADAADAQKAIDVIMIAKYLERIGDHATNIAEWVDFSITGVHDVSFDTKSA